MPRIYATLILLACLLPGCRANPIPAMPAESTDETAVQTAGTARYAGESALVLLYSQDTNGDNSYLCSGALVTLDDPRTAQPGILTASHCFTDADPDAHAFVASFDDGNSFHVLKHAWLGDNMRGADIAFAEFDAASNDTVRAHTSLRVALTPSTLIAGDPLWTWGNPDDQGRALTLGYVMNPEYRKPPITGTIDRSEALLDLRGYIVTELNTAPGSSGGVVLGQHGVIGVVSADFKHSSQFRTVFVTPVARLEPLLARPPEAIGKRWEADEDAGTSP